MKKNLQTRFSTRQYMLSRDFEIYYYKDNTLAGVDSHTHDYYEFYFFLEGDVSLEIAGRIFPLRYGDVVLIPPGTPHQPYIRDSRTPYRRFVFWVTGGVSKPDDGNLGGLWVFDAVCPDKGRIYFSQ